MYLASQKGEKIGATTGEGRQHSMIACVRGTERIEWGWRLKGGRGRTGARIRSASCTREEALRKAHGDFLGSCC